MANTYLPYSLDQRLLLPPDLRDWLPEKYLALFVSDAVDELDLKPITDHDCIAAFRKENIQELGALFVQVLELCQKAGLVKLGHVALDGTKVKANASKHKAMSYDRMSETEKRLQEEVARLLKEAEQVDAEEDVKYGRGKRGDEIPRELERRESRLKKIREAKAELEAQRNLADPESRIMKDGASKGFEQAYNAQAVVDAEKR